MTAFTISSMQNLPAGLRNVISKHFADSRWRETCAYYNSLHERDRLTICFHAQMKKRHTIYRLEEMPAAERERIVCAIDELRNAFSESRRGGVSILTFLGRLSVSERRALFMHAGLSEKEFNQPFWHIENIDNSSCQWSKPIFRALNELVSLFNTAPDILTAIKPEEYLN
ncbi:replication protein B [Pectobacterium carotovorum]|uniref:replication protein B n=1 Tax=Pectobacterium carotovorum TaxID=554 RepID=UPI00191DAED6|nr:replication protein B [Pectobacterium carotovorum]MBL0909084.1 replication protein B [Pectobacterium carotovorum]MCL6366034.1 replication protein B [Pectobacterium carotovorum subsp. carotovorum]MDX6917589.1 replication protein B [Pectobacterium carotovorum]